MEETRLISVGTVGQDVTKYITRMQSTADYLVAKLSDKDTKYQGKVIIAKTVEDMVRLLKDQEIDLYFESPVTMLLVAERSGAEPFLVRWKQGVPEYHSVFIVKKESPIKTLDDFVGKTIIFENPESTSGYLMPKAYLIGKGYDVSPLPANDNIAYVFSGEDENTFLWLFEGRGDIGATSNIDLERAPTTIKEQLRVVDRTMDVPRHMVAHRSDLEPELVEKIKQILLNMDEDLEGIVALRNFEESTKYDEISNKEELFDNIRKMLTLVG